MRDCPELPFCGSLILSGGPEKAGGRSDLHGYWVCVWCLQKESGQREADGPSSGTPKECAISTNQEAASGEGLSWDQHDPLVL